MEKDEKGYFKTTVELEDGVYQYKFRVQTKSPNFEQNQLREMKCPQCNSPQTTNNGHY